MNKHGELPPPYEEEMPVETTPLLRPPRRIQRRKLRVAAAALLIPYLIFGFIFFYFFNSTAKEKAPEVPVRIAVIGAGPAGVSAAFSLSKLASAKGIEINITIFDEKNGVGGRMLLNANGTGHSFQEHLTILPEDVASGNLLHNRIFRERAAKALADEYGKDWETLRQSSNVGFFDGEKIISVATRPADKSDWGEWLGRVFKYGTSVWRARKLPIGTMDDFQKLLNLDGTYDDVGGMLAASENLGSRAKTALERLKINGLSQKYIRDVLGPQVRRHTAQGVEELSDLALSMALDREDQGVQTSEFGGRLTTTLGKFVNKSKAKLKPKAKVTGLRRREVEDGKESWILQYSEEGNQYEAVYEAFDKVIIAAPWNTSSLLPVFSDNGKQIQYRSEWLTFFTSNTTLNTIYFGGAATLPAQIVPIISSKLPPPLQEVQEITHLKDISIFDQDTENYRTNHLYRVVSTEQIDLSTIHLMLDGPIIGFHQEEIGNAYPFLYARTGEFLSFKVMESLWHTSAIEAIGCSVDLSWIAGENVARLVGKDI